MGIFIKAKSKQHGNLEFAIQQYEVGLYICVYKEGHVLEQFGCRKTVKQFIKSLKKCEDLVLENENNL